MRQLRCLLSYAARSMQRGAALGAMHESQLWCGVRAAAACGQRAWGNALDMSRSPPRGIAGFATEPPAPGRDGQDSRHPATSAAAAGEPHPPNGELPSPAEDVEAKLRALGFEDDDGTDLDPSLKPIDLAALGSSSDDDLDTDLLSTSESDEEEDTSELYILRKAARAAAKKQAAEAAAAAKKRQVAEDAEAMAAAAKASQESELEAEWEASGASGRSAEGVLAAAGRQMSVLQEIQQASKKRQRFLLQQQLSGRGDSNRLAEELEPPETGDFSMKVVDVNRTSKGARAGRVQGFSALVVVGNGNGILGEGSGKALEAKAAVDKATRKALKHLTYVPRFRQHTIHYPITVLYGKTKLIMYPKASGRGIMANNLMTSLCLLAGIQDVGIKIQGSRNLRNSVRALFKAFDQMSTRVDEDSVDREPIHPLPLRPLPPLVLDTTGWDEMEEMPTEQDWDSPRHEHASGYC